VHLMNGEKKLFYFTFFIYARGAVGFLGERSINIQVTRQATTN